MVALLACVTLQRYNKDGHTHADFTSYYIYNYINIIIYIVEFHVRLSGAG